MYRVIIGFAQQERCGLIRDLVMGNGYLDVVTCTSGAEVLRHAQDGSGGIVLCGMKLRDMMYNDVYDALPYEYGQLVILSRSQSVCFDDEDLFHLVLPVNKQDLLKTIGMILEVGRKGIAVSPQSYFIPQGSSRSDMDRLLIERAKLFLMNRNHISEEAAHRYLQKKSMDLGLKMVETAKWILKS